MNDESPILVELQETRRRFLQLIEEVRPDLHRYCARMTGSIADGEDVVQDTLARAYYELSALKELPALRSWLFRIAHNRALDFLRRYDRRMGEPLDAAHDVEAAGAEPDQAIARDEAVRVAVSRFLELVPLQRSCVILKDVLDCSLQEIAVLLELSIPAIKAALHRGRVRLLALSATTDAPASSPMSPTITRYAALFNARDWDGVRAMLVADVKLEVVSVSKRAGKEQVGVYFTNYDQVHDWHLRPGWLEGRPVIAVFRDPRATRPGYFVELTLRADGVSAIRDFRHIPYIGRDLSIDFAPRQETGAVG